MCLQVLQELCSIALALSKEAVALIIRERFECYLYRSRTEATGGHTSATADLLREKANVLARYVVTGVSSALFVNLRLAIYYLAFFPPATDTDTLLAGA